MPIHLIADKGYDGEVLMERAGYASGDSAQEKTQEPTLI
jgi:hypothetical protein